MGPGYLVLAALAVPVGTFAGLWFWRLRPARRKHSSTDTPYTEADLADMASNIFARQQYLQAQVAEAWEARERRLTAQVAGLLESAQAPSEITLHGLDWAKVTDRREPEA